MKKMMLKTACLAFLICGLLPAAAFAGPCTPGSLASFIALDCLLVYCRTPLLTSRY